MIFFSRKQHCSNWCVLCETYQDNLGGCWDYWSCYVWSKVWRKCECFVENIQSAKITGMDGANLVDWYCLEMRVIVSSTFSRGIELKKYVRNWFGTSWGWKLIGTTPRKQHSGMLRGDIISKISYDHPCHFYTRALPPPSRARQHSYLYSCTWMCHERYNPAIKVLLNV